MKQEKNRIFESNLSTAPPWVGDFSHLERHQNIFYKKTVSNQKPSKIIISFLKKNYSK
jgi:hypothetical protein